MTQTPPPPAPPQVSLIVPVYNEEKNLSILSEEILTAMRAQKRAWEVVFVDDGSRDGSLAVLRDLAAASPSMRYIAFEENRGQSAAFAAGFLEARGDVIVTLDSDLQNDPADIPRMLDRHDREGGMVIGWRAKRQDTLVKRLSSKIANAVRNRLSRENVRDTGCSLKVMPASLARRLPMFTGMHRFFPTLVKMHGVKVTEMEVNHRPRRHGSSKYGVWDRAFSAFYDLLAVRWMQSRHIRYRIRERSRNM